MAELVQVDDAIFFEQLTEQWKEAFGIFESVGITARQILLVCSFLNSIDLPVDMDTNIEYCLQYLFNGQGLGYFHMLTPQARLVILNQIANKLAGFHRQDPCELIEELGNSLFAMTRVVNLVAEEEQTAGEDQPAFRLRGLRVSLKRIYYDIYLPKRYFQLES